MNSIIVAIFSVFLASCMAMHVPQEQKEKTTCQPNINCKLPNCRCWNDPEKPGDTLSDYTPQMLLLIFSYAINKHTVQPYLELFKNRINPNGCPIKGTFFAQDNDTSADVLASLFNNRHEIAITSADGRHPRSKSDWRESLFVTSEKLYDAGIARDQIEGVLAPGNFIGGNAEMEALQDLEMLYDASCVVGPDKKSKKPSTLWPFTYDFNDGNTPKCNLGKKPSKTYPGMWQFVQQEMRFKNHTCTSLSTCSPFIHSHADAFTFFFDMFQSHYYGNRAPIVLFIDPLWMSKSIQRSGLDEFLKVANTFSKTWMVTMSQALQWIRSPVPFYPSIQYMPWDCSDEEKQAHKQFHVERF